VYSERRTGNGNGGRCTIRPVHLDDTIVAIATPPGRGGIGVVRLAGAEARAIAAPMLRLKHPLEAGRAIFGELIDPETGERIDEVVATFFAKPHSYTSDDVVEISAHGSPVVLEHVVGLALASGARLAEPGEFTMRAFLNGRIDLTQAEAVRDLIDSRTLFQARVAAQQLGGALSGRIAPVKQKLVELIAVLEAGIDFAEDDVAVLPARQAVERIASIREPLERLRESFAFGKVVHEGLTLAIVGAPNVGKSSLFNQLVERERAIVTATPGTTRDLVSETVAIGGIPVRLVDTAGIRHALDEAESIGVRKSLEAVADADIVLIVADCAAPEDEGRELTNELLDKTAGRKRLLVANKNDLCGVRAETTFFSNAIHRDGIDVVRTSALTGQGIDELRSKLLDLAGAGGQHEQGFLTNLRHRELITSSLAALDQAARALSAETPHEMVLLDLYNGLKSLDEITGATTTEDILGVIFSSFCIGK
jgi:tRNA modification GTPase